MSVAASNVPDLDLLLTSLTGGKLGYLLHHRGHTHTLVLQPLIAAVVVIPSLVAARHRAHVWTRRDNVWLAALAFVAATAHLALDFLNSYGVHVLWPFDNRWAFGDALFIVEPMLWLALAVPLAFAARGLGARGLLLGVSILALGLVWFSGFVPMPSMATGWALLLAAATRVTPRGRRGLLSLGAAAAFVLASLGISQILRARIERAYASSIPTGRLADIALTPMPANLFCWRIITVSVEGEAYVMRDGMLAAWGDVMPVAGCPDMASGGTAPIRPVEDWDDTALRWRGAYTEPLADLRQAAGRCGVGAFLRFARTPFRVPEREIVGDLRFDRGQGSFTEIEMPAGMPCPRNVPPWEPPLAPLLE